MMSPFEGLDKPISLQAWGYQLKVDNADDGRIDEFIDALRVNASVEPGAACSGGITATGTTPRDRQPATDGGPAARHAGGSMATTPMSSDGEADTDRERRSEVGGRRPARRPGRGCRHRRARRAGVAARAAASGYAAGLLTPGCRPGNDSAGGGLRPGHVDPPRPGGRDGR